MRNRNRARFDLRNRLLLVGGALALCSVSLVGRAAYVQLVDNEFYQKEGDARFVREIAIPTSRGMITDRNGEPVAVSSPVESVWCDPQELMEKAPDRLPELARALGEPADALTRRVGQRADKEFMYLKRRMNPDAARRIVDLGIPGVYSRREFRRFYPQGEAMAHVLGFTNIDDRGQEGLELAFDDWLRGKPGTMRVIRDRKGRIVENLDLVQAAEPGRDLTLSIDRRIQYLTYRELKRRLWETGSSSGSAVVLDVATGEVLAMANLPTFNPNASALGKPETHRNRAITDVVEPGSTMKPITVAAALKAGVVTPNTLVDVSPGYMALDRRWTVHDTHNYGVQTVTGLITKSSNIGAVKLSAKLPDQQYYDFVRSFGYGQKPGSGFPGESTGSVPPPPRWSGTTKATMSYGYGLNATPLQIARAYAALANGGKLIAPSFVKGQHNEAQQVLDPAIAGEVMKMMQTVTEPGGTATQAAILGYHVAGKTGTARKSANGGYSNRYISLFAGVVPVEHPRFAMAVVVSEPDPSKGHGYYGGLVAAPVFHNVMDGALRLMDVPPDDIETWLAVQARTEAKAGGAR
ncbi:cell division protein [Pseudoxanthomonas kalamensis DSM 18571]|nr:cell division protein [Pseudoxanthomonas kalamensis DSM 18571]